MITYTINELKWRESTSETGVKTHTARGFDELAYTTEFEIVEDSSTGSYFLFAPDQKVKSYVSLDAAKMRAQKYWREIVEQYLTKRG